MDDIAVLIGQSYTTDAYGQSIATETQCPIWAHQQDLTRAEFFAAGRSGLDASFVLLTQKVNYHGERIVEWKGIRYGIYRTYSRGDSDEVELYLERKAGVTHG